MLDNTQRDEVTVEAETVEDALAQISSEFGENAEIMRAQKVHRGGVGGFFAKEIVQLTARRRTDEAPKLRPAKQPKGGGITDVLERMAQDADAEDSDFRTVLQRELTTEAENDSDSSFLEATGWTESNEDETPDPINGGEDVLPTFEDETDVLKPVAVGPVLNSLAEPVVEDPAPSDSVPAATPTQEIDFDEVADIVEAAVAAQPEAAAESDPASEAISASAANSETVVEMDWANAESVDEIDPTPESELTTDGPAEWRSAEPADAPPGMGAVAWSTTALLRLGLPGPLISAVSDLEPGNDLGWIESIAAAIAPHCGPLPQGDLIVVGPHAERLAEPLGLPLVRSGEMAPYAGSFCAMVDDSAEDRQWLEFVRGGRGIHLVVGDEPWQDLLIGEPLAVSWVGETAVADALYLAFTLGSTLGYGTVDGFVSSMVRAQPADVALAVRRIVGRR